MIRKNAMKSVLGKLLALALAIGAAGCEEVDSNRIPPLAVHLDLGNAGLWNTYGVHGYGQARYFDKRTNVGGFPFTANTYTGFGGILLVYGMNGPVAYDRACPVELDRDVVLSVDPDNYEAVCRKCGSRYNVCEAGGAPVYGPAVEKKYGLQRFAVIPAGGGYIVSR